MVTNTGFISTLAQNPTTELTDNSDNIHSGLIKTLNASMGENRAISGFNITQGTSGGYTSYVVTSGQILRNGLLVDVSNATLTNSSTANAGYDWYGLIVVCDGTESGETANTLKWRQGAVTGKTTSNAATVAELKGGDIPIAMIKYASGSANNLSDSTTPRPIQYLTYTQTKRELSIGEDTGSDGDMDEKLRIASDGKIYKNGSSYYFDFPTISANRTIATTADITSITSSNLVDGAVLTAKIADAPNGVSTAKINDSAVSTAKIADDAITNAKIGAGAVDTTEIADDAVTYAKMQNVANANRVLGSTSAGGIVSEVEVETAMIADNAVTVGKISGLTDLGSGEVISSSERTKLSGIETSADVTDSTNVLSALNADLGGDFTIGTQSDDTATFGGNVTVQGDLLVSGTTTTINTATLDVADNNITLNSDLGSGVSPTQNAGITINRGSGTDKTLIWNETSDKWSIGSETFVAGTVEAALTGNATTATALATARNVSISGDVTASAVSFDGSGNVALSATIDADAVTTAKILDANVTTDKIANDAITGAKIANDSIDSEHIAADSIDAEHYAEGSVDTTALGADAVTSAKISDDAIGSEHIADGAVLNAHLAGSISQSKVTNLVSDLAAKQATLTFSTGLTNSSNTVSVDIDNLDIENGINRSADYLMYDDATNGLRKINLDNIFTKITDSDIPSLNASKITAGTFGAARIPNLDTSKITTGTFATARIADDAITFDKIANVASGVILGRDTSGTGSIEALSASEVRAVIGVDASGTDNSTDVTLATVSDNYLSISNQTITAGTVPLSLGGTGATSAAAARTALGVDAAGTDNSTDVSLSGSYDYLSLTNQTITLNQIDYNTDIVNRPTIPNTPAIYDNSGSPALHTGITAAEVRTLLGVDSAGADNSTDVTLTGKDYLTISGQAITVGEVDISDDTNLVAGTNISLSGDTLNVDTDLANYDNTTSGFLTAHPVISGAASSSDNSGRTYIQDITLDSNGHVTGITTATETVTDTTYSVGDGGLTEINYTSAKDAKLTGIAANANNYALPTATSSALGGVKIGSGITITDGVISADSQSDVNFTSALNTKLTGIAAGATVGADWTSNVSNISVTNDQLAGSIANGKLANSSVTINSNSLALGETLTLDTDDISEGSNLYHTTGRVNTAVDSLLQAGEGIDLSYNSELGTLTISSEDASYTNKGVASFSSSNFVVNTGVVSLTTAINSKLALLDNVTSDIQAQLNAKQSSGSYLTSVAVADLSDISSLDTNLTTTSASHDTLASALAVKQYVDTQITSLNIPEDYLTSVALADLTDIDGIETSFSSINSGNSYLASATAIKTYVDDSISEARSADYTISAVDGDGTENEIIRLTGTDNSNSEVIMEAGAGMSVTRIGSRIIYSSDAAAGVTSVGMSVPTGFTISGSPITSTGTLALSYTSGYVGYTTAEQTKLSGIETSADVTDATNVAAAGAIMDSDFTTNGLMKRTGAGTYTIDSSAYITDYTVTESDVTAHQAALSITESQISDLGNYATETYVNTQVSGLVDSAPAALDTLNELAAALGDDANFSTTMTTSLGNRVRVDTASQGLTVTQKSNARTNIDVDPAGTDNSTDVTLVTTSHDYLSLSGQAITLGTIDISDDTNLAAGSGITLTGDTLSLTNDSVTINSNSLSLGGTLTLDTDDIGEGSNQYFTNERVDDRVNALLTAGSNVSLTYNDSANTLTIASTDTNTQLSTEQVQDIVGAMFASNTETRISATYQDGDGTIDLVVDDMTANTQLSQEEVEDYVGGLIAAGTGISVNYDDAGGSLTITNSSPDQTVALTAGSNVSISGTYPNFTIASTDTNTQLTTEQVQDIIGGMVSGNTETNIAVTYDDTNGKLDFVSTDTNTQLTLLDEDNFSSNSATAAASQQSIKAYVDAEVSGLVDSAPSALNTLNELAAALGDDANYATTTSTALGNRLRIDTASQGLTSTQQSNALTNLGITATLAEINILDDGLSASDIPNLATSKITSGTFADARIAASNVTQHQAALSITESQISDLQSYLTAPRTITAGGNTLANGETLAFTAGSNITITESGGAVTIAATDTNTQLTTEQVEDIVGAMVSGNTETNITVTYDDTNGKLDFSASGTSYSAASGGGLSLSGTAFSIDDPINLSQLTESTDATDDKILLWDESASSWKYMTLDDLQDSIDTTATGGAGEAFKTISVSGQSDVVADLAADTLTLAEGSNVTITTNASSDTITIAATDTNTQLSQEQVEDYVNGLIVAGSNITKTYDDAAGTLTIAATDTNTQLTQEQVEDYVNGVIVAGSNITKTYDDAAGTLTLAATDTNTFRTVTAGGNTLGGSETLAFTAGSNVTITESAGAVTIASTDTNTTYSAGSGLDLSGTTFSVDVSDFMTNGANNRLVTATGTDGMNSEANLTFDGSTLTVTGHVAATTKSFVIPHPTKEGMTLHHGSLEGPEHAVYCRGRLRDDNIIQLPEYWKGLVDEDSITVQLTPHGDFQMLYVEKIENNEIYVLNEADEGIDCFYIVHGERKDIGKLEVEY